MKQTPKTIHEFKKGDKITRIQPSKPVMKLGEEDVLDRNFIGTPFIFVGLANGCIYLRRIMPDLNETQREFMSMFSIFGPSEPNPLTHLETELFEDGWDYYIDPLTLENDTSVDTIDNSSIAELEKQKEAALKLEDYIEADRIQKLLNNKIQRK
jgi:hypothetical protein